MCARVSVVEWIIVCFGCVCFKQKTAYEMRISDWSADVGSSDLRRGISRSLNVSVRRFVAPTVALAAGVELTSLGWASAGVDRPIDRIARRAANLVFVFIEHLRWVRCTLRSSDAYPSLPSPD